MFETVLFALTIAKFLSACRQGWGMGPIMQQFVADGTWAYALIFLAMLVKGALTIVTFGIKVPAGIFIPTLGGTYPPPPSS